MPPDKKGSRLSKFMRFPNRSGFILWSAPVLGAFLALATIPFAAGIEHFFSSEGDLRILTQASIIQPGAVVIWRDGEYVD
jgi:hypothetical protein